MTTGEYNRYGYSVKRDGEVIYEAGNHPGESTIVTDLEDGLPLKTLRRYCAQTTRELADETSDHYGGVTRIDDDREAWYEEEV